MAPPYRAALRFAWGRRVVAGVLAIIGASAQAASPASSELIKRGAYLTSAGDCVACHTAEGGKPFAGGLYMNTPFGQVSTPNITPDKATGIGGMSDQAFYRVMHEGIGAHGEYLYPVMPFPWYTTVTRDDVKAIKAFLMTQEPVHKERPPNKLSFPFSVRKSLLVWREAFFQPHEFKPDPAASEQVNRGAYLVNGLGHCGECHNGRLVTGASKFSQPLQGGVIDNWYAPNITSDVRDGIGGWSQEELAHFLKTGASPGKGIAVGPMAQTVHSLSKLDDSDLAAIAAYLKSTPPKGTSPDQKLQLFAGKDARGGSTYLNYCASCHGLNGKGIATFVPALDGNGAVTAKGPQNIINVIVGGLEARGRYAPMPAIGASMNNEEIADVANFVRQTWGNAAPATAMPGMAAEARGKIDTLMNASPGGECPAIKSPQVAKAIAAQSAEIDPLLGATRNVEMPGRAQKLVARVRAASPGIANADLVNGLTSAYCGVIRADASLKPNERAERLGNFSELIFTAASGEKLLR